jgi:hypothetical protein
MLNDVQKNNLVKLRESKDANAKEGARLQKLYEYFKGNQIEGALSFGNETAIHKNMRPKFAPNFLRKAVIDLSYLYAVDPIRTSDNFEAWDGLLWNPSEGESLNALMLEADVLTRLCGTSLAVLMADDEGNLNTWIFPRWKFEALASPNNPRKLEAALVYWNDAWLYIDNTHYYFSDKQESIEHNLGCLPACTLKNTISANSVYGDAFGGQDLLQNIETINLQLAELTYVSMLQRGQPVMVGDKNKNLVLGPDSVVQVEEIGGFTIVPNNANIGGMMNAVQMNLDALAISCGIAKRAFNVRSVLEPTSAEMVYAAQLELSQDRQVRERVAKQWEKNIHKIAKTIIWNVAKIDLDLPQVKYVEFAKVNTPSDIREKIKLEKELGIADTLAVAQQLNPGTNPLELEAQLESAKNELTEESRKKAIIAGRNGTDIVAND